MTPQQKADYELESIMRASLKPIAKQSKPKQSKQHEGASA